MTLRRQPTVGLKRQGTTNLKISATARSLHKQPTIQYDATSPGPRRSAPEAAAAPAAAAPAAASDVESDSAEMLLAEEMALVARASSQELPVHEIVDQPPEPAPPPAEPPAPQPPPYDAALVKSRSLRD